MPFDLLLILLHDLNKRVLEGACGVADTARPGVDTAWNGRAMPRTKRKPPPPPPRWLPRAGAHYYLILGNGMIQRFPWNGTDFDHEAWNFGNCFKTHAQAIQAREKMREVLLMVHKDHA